MKFKNTKFNKIKKKLGVDSTEDILNKDYSRNHLDKVLSGAGSTERKILNKHGRNLNSDTNNIKNKNLKKRKEALLKLKLKGKINYDN